MVTITSNQRNIKTTLRYHFARIRWAKIKKVNNKYLAGTMGTDTLLGCRWKCGRAAIATLRKSNLASLAKLSVPISYGPAVPPSIRVHVQEDSVQPCLWQQEGGCNSRNT